MAQEFTDKMTGKLQGGLVRPKDKVTVYATDKARFRKAGDPFNVHTALADKLIAQGKATKEKPADAAAEKAKK